MPVEPQPSPFYLYLDCNKPEGRPFHQPSQPSKPDTVVLYIV